VFPFYVYPFKNIFGIFLFIIPFCIGKINIYSTFIFAYFTILYHDGKARLTNQEGRGDFFTFYGVFHGV